VQASRDKSALLNKICLRQDLQPSEHGFERSTLKMNPLTTEPNSRPRHIAFVGDYLPRHCGIATFTYDLCEAVAARYSDTDCFVGALRTCLRMHEVWWWDE